MAFCNLAKRMYYRSSRSQNPQVLLNIQLTHCKEVKDLITMITDKNLLLPQKTFALRMIGRALTSLPFDIIELEHPVYHKLVKEVSENINILKPLELCDVSFWHRIVRNLGRSPLSFENVKQLISLIENCSKSHSLTIRQTVSLLYDSSILGKSNQACFEYIRAKLSNLNEFITSDDIRQLFICAKHTSDSLNISILDSIVSRVIKKYDVTWKSKELTTILLTYCEICSKAHMELDNNFVDFCISKIMDKDQELGEIQNHEILCTEAVYNVFPKSFTENILKKFISNVKYSSRRYSHVYVINILKHFIDYRKDDKGSINAIIEEIVRRIETSDLGDSMLSRYLAQLIPEEINTESIYKKLATSNTVIENFKRKSFMDLFIFFSKHENAENVIRRFGITVKNT